MSEKTVVVESKIYGDALEAQARDALRQARAKIDGLVQREGALVELLRRALPTLEAHAERLRARGAQEDLNEFLHLDMLLLRIQRLAPADPTAQGAQLEQEQRRAHVVSAAADFVDADRAVDELNDKVSSPEIEAAREVAELRFTRAWRELHQAVDVLRTRRTQLDLLQLIEAGRG